MKTFTVRPIPDSGEFARGDQAALAWDILHAAATHKSCDSIDLGRCTHLKPYAVACLCGMAELARMHGREVRAVPPTDAGCAEHLTRIGVPEFIEGDWPDVDARASNIAARRVRWPPGDEGERILEVLAPRAGLPPGVFARMVEGLDEIILNALTHAASPIDCIVVGQAFPATRKVEVAVLDLGRTILGHLTSNPEYTDIHTDQVAIQKALEEGVTGTPAGQRNIRGEQNSGAGLSWLREYCERGGGELTVLSGSNWITCAPANSPVVGSLHRRFQGCLVNIRYFADFSLPRAGAPSII